MAFFFQQCVLGGDQKVAEQLKKEFKVPDKRFDTRLSFDKSTSFIKWRLCVIITTTITTTTNTITPWSNKKFTRIKDILIYFALWFVSRIRTSFSNNQKQNQQHPNALTFWLAHRGFYVFRDWPVLELYSLLRVERYLRLLWFCYALLCDWFTKLGPIFRSQWETKPNQSRVAHVHFPALGVGCLGLVHWAVYDSCD